MSKEIDDLPYSCEKVITEIGKQQYSNSNWMKNILILFVSLSLFFSFGLLKFRLNNLLIIILVLLVHEVGHFIGMYLFGYQNMKIFFIPFFGAGVSGQTQNVPTYKKALVDLLGPVPGIFLAIVFGILYIKTNTPVYRSLALIFFLINSFNLLPLFPLDGGQFLQHVFFSKHKHLELLQTAHISSTNRVRTFSRIWLLGLLGLVNFFWGRVAFQVAQIADDLKDSFDENDMPISEALLPKVTDSEIISPEIAKKIIRRICQDIPSRLTLEIVAKYTWQVWERMHSRPPKELATFTLLAVYILSLIPLLAASMSFAVVSISDHVTEKKIIVYQKPIGELGRKEQAYLRGKLIYEHDIAADQLLYHGRGVSYYQDGTIKTEGAWYDGKWDGDWKHYDRKGKLIRIVTMNKGEFVQCKELEDGKWVEKSLKDLPFWLRKGIMKHAEGPPLGPKDAQKAVVTTN